MFSAEKDLVEAFKNVAAEFLEYDLGNSTSQFFLVEEFDSCCGIADIVMGRGAARTGILLNLSMCRILL